MRSTSFNFLVFLAVLPWNVALASGPEPVQRKSVTQTETADEVFRRKAELRAALQTQNPPAVQATPDARASPPPGRLLTDQERANLRQQIRQQRP